MSSTAADAPVWLGLPADALRVVTAFACDGFTFVLRQPPPVRDRPRAMLRRVRAAYCTVQRLRRVCRATAAAAWLPDEAALFRWFYRHWEAAIVCSPARAPHWSADALLSDGNARTAAWLGANLTRETASLAVRLALGRRPSDVLRVKKHVFDGDAVCAETTLRGYLAAPASSVAAETLFLGVSDFCDCPTGGLVPLSAARDTPRGVHIEHPDCNGTRSVTLPLDVCVARTVEICPAASRTLERRHTGGPRRVVVRFNWADWRRHCVTRTRHARVARERARCRLELKRRRADTR